MRRRIVRIGLPILVIAAILMWAFRPAAVPADFSTVARGRLEVTVDEEGQTRVRDRYVVSAPVPGRMQRIQLEAGDPVTAGKTVVATFLPTDPALLDVRTRAELEARVKAAGAALGSAKAEEGRAAAELEFAQSELERNRKLLEGGAIAQRDLEQAQRQEQALARAHQSAAYAARTAQYQLDVARAALLQTRSGQKHEIQLYSPVDGIVLRRLQESAAVVPAGQPLLEIGNLKDLEIVSDLLSSAAVTVRPGQPVRIEQWGGDHALDGTVRRVEPSGFTKISALGVEEQRVNAIIDFDDPPASRPTLGDGFRVEVRIIVWAKDDVLKVPTSSLFRIGEAWAVYVAQDGIAHARTVSVGQRSGAEAEILKGLSAGERIIVFPSDAIADGVRVAARG
jgi:HlyD family secretion protein